MTESITQEEISERMDRHEIAARCWRSASYVLAFVTVLLMIIGTLCAAEPNLLAAQCAFPLFLGGITGLFAWLCRHAEIANIQDQRVLDWDYFNSNTENEEELHNLQSEVWDLKRQIQEKNQMIRQLTEPEQTVRVRSITALALLPR